MKDNLSLHPYKPIITQGLKADDFPRLLSYSNSFLSGYQQKPEFLRNLLFTDEKLFHLSDIVNKQNVRFWSTDSPNELQETRKFSPHLNVWIAIGARHIFGPYFFEEEGATVTTNTNRYIKILINKFFVDLKRKGNVLKNTYSQQDNSRVHTAETTQGFSRTKLNPEKIISKDLYLTRSPDLTPPDFFFFDYIISKVYANSPSFSHWTKKKH